MFCLISHMILALNFFKFDLVCKVDQTYPEPFERLFALYGLDPGKDHTSIY